MLWLGLLALAALLAWGLEARRRVRHPVPPGHQPGITLPHAQPFELYHNALSLCSMKARVCLAELGIAYASHPIDLIETGAYENIRAPFLRVNPGGTVPVLVHDGHPVYESHEQIRYAARVAPTGRGSLVPDDPGLRAEMERWIDRSSLTGDPMREGAKSAANAVPGLTVPLFAAMIDRIAFWRIFEGLLFHFDKRRPMLFMLLKTVGLGRLGSLGAVVKAIANSRARLAVHLDALEDQLEKTGGPWILGETFTLADVSWLVIFERLRQADCLHVFLGGGRRPRGAAYWAGLTGRPSYREAILEHSHPTIAYGTERLRRLKAADPGLREAVEGPQQ
jgi:glutathione S-transferase